jgi:hypothetical protein
MEIMVSKWVKTNKIKIQWTRKKERWIKWVINDANTLINSKKEY